MIPIWGQSANQLVREGNKMFSSKKYAEAETLYRKALAKDSNHAVATYNLARTLQAENKSSESISTYTKAEKLASASDLKSSSYYNTGTIYQQQKDFNKAIEAYKNALRINPKHNNARYNLELCLRQQQQQGGQSNNSQNKDKQNKQKDKQQNKKNKQNQNNKNKNNKPDRNQKNNPAKGNEMSKENAEQLLNAAKQQEKETQERLSKMMRQPSDRVLKKNW